jgi:SnoaL-like domain
MDNIGAAQPGRHWSVDAFKAFWSKPDVSTVSGVLTEDVVGYWPRPIGIVRGACDYTEVIETILRVCPDFHLKVPEHAVSGDFAFVRWIAMGTAPAGAFEFTGCDRVRTRNGQVCENYVFCDDPFFVHLAAALGQRK